MARCAARDGITAIVCTPHMDTFGNTAVALSRHALVRKALQERLDGEGIPLHLYGGAEWMVSEELVNVLQDLPEGRLARSDTFLFELSVFMQPAVIGRLLFAVRRSAVHGVFWARASGVRCPRRGTAGCGASGRVCRLECPVPRFGRQGPGENGPPPARYYLRKERESSWKSRKGRGRCKRRRPKKRGCWK